MWSVDFAFIGLGNEVWGVASVLNQKQRELSHLGASYACILNPLVSLLASHLY